MFLASDTLSTRFETLLAVVETKEVGIGVELEIFASSMPRSVGSPERTETRGGGGKCDES
jgi:hypothetical protein